MFPLLPHLTSSGNRKSGEVKIRRIFICADTCRASETVKNADGSWIDIVCLIPKVISSVRYLVL